MKIVFLFIVLNVLINEEYIFFKVIFFFNKYSLFFLIKENKEELGKGVFVSVKVIYDKCGLFFDLVIFIIYCIESDCLDIKFIEFCDYR